MLVAQFYPVADGWGFAILKDGGRVIVQDSHPEKAGAVAMTRSEAEACAAAVIGRIGGVPAAPAELLEKIDFLRLFTDAELEAILEAATQIPAVAVYQYKLSQSPGVFLSDPDIQAGIPALEAAQLLAPGRAAQILRNERPAQA